MTDQPLDLIMDKRARRKIKRAKNLSKTILLVPSGFPGSIDIDADPLGWHRIADCKESDLRHYIGIYRRSFFRDVDAFTLGVRGKLQITLETLLQTWNSNRFLLLGQLRPQFDSHFEVIQEYLMWQIRERGWDNRPN